MDHSAAWQAIPTAPAEGRQRWRIPRPHLTSLQTRLIVSHGFVLILALLLVLGISAASLRRYERQAEIERLSDLAVPLAVEAGTIMRQGNTTSTSRLNARQLLKLQAREMGTRILVFSPKGVVLYDTQDAPNLDGQTLRLYAKSIAAVHSAAQRSVGVHRAAARRTGKGSDPLAGQLMVVASGSKSLHSTPQVVFGLVSSQKSVPLLGRYLPRLLIAAGAALVIALLAGYILSLRIAAPLRRLTRAADAMAAGDLEQRVPGEERDEIGRLVASFNLMSTRVAAMTRSQRDLLANIAHELRTPLTSVQGYTQALRDRVIADPKEQDEALATIGGEAERMGRLIGQLLDLARLEAGQTALAAEPVNVEALLATVQRRFAPEAARRDIMLQIETPPDLLIRGDEERLQQVLGNLMSNALRFTPVGGQITMGAAPVALTKQDAGGVRLTVRDTGQGIAPERLPHIFDRFERGEGDRAGFGLGLAIVRELVHAHGGEIAAASRLGQGTTFTIDLPVATFPVAAGTPAPAVAAR